MHQSDLTRGAPLHLWTIRHAPSALSGSGRWQGWSTVSLSTDGRNEARRLRNLLDVPNVSVVYSSPLQRCVETAEIIMPGAKVVLDDRLRTRHLGEWEGLTASQIADRGGAWFHPFAEPAPPGGESLLQLSQRLLGFVQSLLQERESNAVAITHGAPIGLLLKAAGQSPYIIPHCTHVVMECFASSLRLLHHPGVAVAPV